MLDVSGLWAANLARSSPLHGLSLHAPLPLKRFLECLLTRPSAPAHPIFCPLMLAHMLWLVPYLTYRTSRDWHRHRGFRSLKVINDTLWETACSVCWRSHYRPVSVSNSVVINGRRVRKSNRAIVVLWRKVKCWKYRTDIAIFWKTDTEYRTDM